MLACLCELSITGSWTAIRCGVVAALLEAVLDTTCPRAQEPMLHAVLHLLNNKNNNNNIYNEFINNNNNINHFLANDDWDSSLRSMTASFSSFLVRKKEDNYQTVAKSLPTSLPLF